MLTFLAPMHKGMALTSALVLSRIHISYSYKIYLLRSSRLECI